MNYLLIKPDKESNDLIYVTRDNSSLELVDTFLDVHMNIPVGKTNSEVLTARPLVTCAFMQATDAEMVKSLQETIVMWSGTLLTLSTEPKYQIMSTMN